MFNKRSIYKRLQGRFVHEENFIKVLDQIDRAFKSYQLAVTDFISPGMYNELKPFLEMERDFTFASFGGYDGAERVRLIVYPDYMTVDEGDFEIILLKSKFPAKFESIEHRDVLGSLMSQGFRREKLGDLYVVDDHIYIYACLDIESYITTNLERIRKVKVAFKPVDLESFNVPKRAYKTVFGTVNSMRLDALVAFAYNVSRTKASNFIKSEQVKVNHRVIVQTTYVVSEGDLLSVRGLGRVEVERQEGKTKKDRLRISLNKYI